MPKTSWGNLRNRRRKLKREFQGFNDPGLPMSEKRERYNFLLFLQQYLDRDIDTKLGSPYRKIMRFGWPFITRFPIQRIESEHHGFMIQLGRATHESPVSIELSHGETPFGSVSLAFAANRQIRIEAIQGARNAQKSLKRVSGIVGMHWPNYLIKKIIAHAKRTGYKTIAFRDPTTLPDYKNPYTEHIEKKHKLSEKQAIGFIRQKMEELYAKIREETGPWEKHGEYWVQTL